MPCPRIVMLTYIPGARNHPMEDQKKRRTSEPARGRCPDKVIFRTCQVASQQAEAAKNTARLIRLGLAGFFPTFYWTKIYPSGPTL